jgi:ABC-type methionine transport system permease subunit
MSTATQVIVLVIAATVFIARLVAALYHSRVDGRIAARRARQERQP